MSKQIWRWVGVGLLLAGCAHPGPAFLREPMANNPALTQVIANATAFAGQRVRWGGSIVQVENRADGTSIEIVERPLDGSGRPSGAGASAGRFIAKAGGFFDPLIYTQGRDVTVTGVVEGEDARKIGDFDYRYVVVKSDNLYLWEPIVPAPPPMYYDPWYYDPWYPWPGWWHRRR